MMHPFENVVNFLFKTDEPKCEWNWHHNFIMNTLGNKSQFLQQNYIQMNKDKQEQKILKFLELWHHLYQL